ncbi:innate immunity activator protein isoform X2 [Onychostoma macrolepis]|uniref:innate immunity activator protein isoform X2 n=1 Tax=Onychostoma macrolepis TaxID=369639 RepID=UPI00272B6A5E|nr:innate immunity activator protein isoform X2 [Onychostoma macrolepis]
MALSPCANTIGTVQWLLAGLSKDSTSSRTVESPAHAHLREWSERRVCIGLDTAKKGHICRLNSDIVENCRVTKINMDCKEEISDSDSGIILNSGPDSPTSPVKDLNTHTRAMRLKQQALEDRLELCVLELKKLCIREAELTGKLPSDYPLLPDEKPPQVRRRIGAAFKLDEGFISQDGEESELHALEADLALQRQIYEAARKLSLEEHISKPVRKSRLQQCKREEKKLKELQDVILKHRINHGCVSPQTCCSSRQRDLCMSDDSSLSDAVALDDAVLGSSADSGFQCLTLLPNNGPKQSSSSSSLDYDASPIQNSPWKESSLDQPYQKQKPSHSACSSRSSSPTGSPTDTRMAELPPAPQFVFKSLPVRNNQPNSAPSTPELPLRRQFSQSFRLPRSKPELTKASSDLGRGRTKLPRRRVTDFALAYSVQRLYQCSSEDSSSELSISSYSSSSSRETTTEAPKPCPPPYGYHRTAPNNGPSQLNTHSTLKNNNKNPPNLVPGPNRVKISNGTPLQADIARLQLRQNSQSDPVHTNKPQQGEVTSPKRMLKPPPPYTKVVRTMSLREYPNHPSRVLPRDVVSGELKTWHQKNNIVISKPRSHERQGSIRIKRPEPPPYHQIPSHKQVSQKVILHRASDGTPLQWFEEEDSEIVSQV